MTFFICFWSVVAGVFGAMVGSFLNVIIYRLPRESLAVNKPRRSFCPSCGSAIPWYDNIPILSFLSLGGHCRHCGAAIPFRYPFVEALTLVLFALLALKEVGPVLDGGPGKYALLAVLLVHLLVIAVTIAVTFIDLEFQIIPNEITFSGILFAPILSLFLPSLHHDSCLFFESLNPHLAGLISSLAGAAVGGGTLYAVGLLGRLMLKREALGLGDVKYMMVVGGLFGADGVLLVFFIGCALGSLVGVPFRLITGRREIPFGPFLSLGVLLLVFFRPEILHFILHTWPEWFRSLLA
jgi:leader peptidase (prepilin peptidase)/N-methyltransferase